MIEKFIQKAIATSRAKKVSSSYYDEVYAGEKLGMDVLIEVKKTSGKGKK